MTEGFAADGGVMADLYGDTEKELTDDDLNPSASAGVNKAGDYHVHCTGVKMEGEDHDGICSVARLTFEILQGTEPDQIGSKVYHRARLFKLIWDKMNDGRKAKDAQNVVDREAYSAEYIKQAIRCAYALRLTDKPSLVGVDWEMALGRQCILRVGANQESYTKDGTTKEVTRYEVGFGNFWRLDHEDVKSVPKDKDALEANEDAVEAVAASNDFSDI